MIMHYKLLGYIDTKLSSFSHYYKAITSAAIGTEQAQIYTSILGVYVYFRRKCF